MSLDRLGLQKTSLIDYPGEVAAVVFTAGCNLSCPYCHNPELISPRAPLDFLAADEVIAYLEKRKNVLGGICITGGEPLVHHDLPDFIVRIRELGLKIKLDTNGMLPERLERIRPDYIAMDVKTSLSKYRLLGARFQGERTEAVQRSIEYILRSGIPHEFRTTVVPGICSEEDVEEIISLIRGCDLYTIAGFRSSKTLSQEYTGIAPYDDAFLSRLLERAATSGIPCRLKSNKSM